MSEYVIREATVDDVPAITAIYNHYVEHTHITFDLEARSLEDRLVWFEQYGETGRHRIIVSEDETGVTGYAGSTQFRTKPAYDGSVETTIYLDPDATGRGLGRALYGDLLGRLALEDVHRAYGCIALPNEGSIALHEKFGFENVGTFHEVGLKFDSYWDVVWYEKAMKS